MPQEVTSFQIKTALAHKHTQEFFLTECKNGPTGTGVYQFDAVAIYKSWAHEHIRIYEVKVSRGDFLRDIKFRAYTPYCHELYMVCPKDMIQRSELPHDVGLMYYNPETKALVTKQKAIHRHIEVSADMLMYIFMNRLDSERPPFTSNTREYLQNWVQDKAQTRELGRLVQSKMANEIVRLRQELDELKHSADARDELRQIDELLHASGGKWYFSRVSAIKDILDKPYPENINKLAEQLEYAVRIIDDIKESYQNKPDEQAVQTETMEVNVS